MLGANVWRRVLGVDRATVIEEIDFDEESETVVVHVRLRRPTKRRCGRCGVRAPGYDQREGRRNWRAIDLGTMQCFLQADVPRVNCPEHGPTVAQVPWARHGAGHTRFFDDQVAWLVTHTAKSTVGELMRIAWRTVGSIIARVVADGRAAHDPFCGLVRIGIDEISYKKGHRYLTIVVDHDTGRLVWAAVGRDKKTLNGFFDLLGEERSAMISLVSADGAEWIAGVVADRAPERHPLHRRLPRGAVVHRCAGRGASGRVERGEEGGHVDPRQGAQRLPLRPVAQPRGPDPPPGPQARLGGQGQHQALPDLLDELTGPRGRVSPASHQGLWQRVFEDDLRG